MVTDYRLLPTTFRGLESCNVTDAISLSTCDVHFEKHPKLARSFLRQQSSINTYIYLEMQKNYFSPELRRLRITRNPVFQQGGAPCHYPRCVRLF